MTKDKTVNVPVEPTESVLQTMAMLIMDHYEQIGSESVCEDLPRILYQAALQSPVDGCVPNYFDELVQQAKTAAQKAQLKFPQPNYVTLKIAEEAGEVVRAGVHYAEERMEWKEVEGEIVQLLAMLIRFLAEGDEVNNVLPPIWVRTAMLPQPPAEGE